MNFSRFREIIIKNREYEIGVKEAVDRFHDLVVWDGDIPKIMKEIGNKLDTLIVEIPMKDSDFGACYLGTGYSHYLLLNSNQPRNKMYFSFCHDLYHILNGTPNDINEKREVHLNQEYFSNEIENKANLFAANLLMPDKEFKKMYLWYSNDVGKLEYTIVKLMNYFNAPFVAILLRLFELQLLENITDVKNLLSFNITQIKGFFKEQWIDKEIIIPSLKDEMEYLIETIKKEGNRLIEEELLSEINFKIILDNIRKLYLEIRINPYE